MNDFGAVTTDGFVSLFNGRDLTGWKMHAGQPGNWRVENGVLLGSDPGRTPGRVSVTPESQIPQGTFLYSERDDFSDFQLHVEAWVNDGGDSGVCFRSRLGPTIDKETMMKPGPLVVLGPNSMIAPQWLRG